MTKKNKENQRTFFIKLKNIRLYYFKITESKIFELVFNKLESS